MPKRKPGKYTAPEIRACIKTATDTLYEPNAELEDWLDALEQVCRTKGYNEGYDAAQQDAADGAFG
jgi:hypothetical protein